MAEQVLTRASGRVCVQPGDLVVCHVARAMLLDLQFTAHRGLIQVTRLYDPDRIAIVLDHSMPAPTVGDAENMIRARVFAKKFGIKHLFHVGNHGISHQIVAERGLALPDQSLTCGDSHTYAGGALNCAARGVGSEMLGIICTGKTWYRIGLTIRYVLVGELPNLVQPKDIFLRIAGVYGDHVNRNVEFVGPVVEPFEPVASDRDAAFEAVREIDVSRLSPYVALPHNME